MNCQTAWAKSGSLFNILKFKNSLTQILFIFLIFINFDDHQSLNFIIMALKPGPKRIAKSTGKPDKRQRDNKDTPGNTPSLKPPKRPVNK